MIFDDHYVIDDWNTSRNWVAQMRATGWWDERIVGSMSYWCYQHLGNLSPEDREEDAYSARSATPTATPGPSCATSPSAPTARWPARAGATAATSVARAS